MTNRELSFCIVVLGFFFKETEALEVLIGQLLDNGRVKEACQVAALLGHYSRDLNIVIVSGILSIL